MSEGHSSSASFVSGWLPQSDNPVYPDGYRPPACFINAYWV